MFRTGKFRPKNGGGRGFFAGMGKAECLRLCRELIEQRRAAALEAMQAAQEAANGEGKSSAGKRPVPWPMPTATVPPGNWPKPMN